MQNKGIVICVAVLLTLASIFYLSFSFATRYYDSEAAKIKDPIAQQDYKDSVKYLGVYSYQNCLETQIGLGLDLKGGMNVILEISVPDVLENLADHKTDAGFTNAMKEARAQEEANGGDFVSLFINAYHKSAPGHKLAEVFATQQLQGKVSPQSSDAEVFFRQGHLCRAHVLVARMAHVVLIRRDVVDDGIDAAILDFEERLIDGVEHADIGPRDLARGLLTRRAD